MTRGEEFERLQFRAIREQNDSLSDIFFHSDCTYESNLVPTELKGRNEENIMWETLKEEIEAGTQKVIYEDENQKTPTVLKDYTVTEKADGLRKMLYISKNGKIVKNCNNYQILYTMK